MTRPCIQQLAIGLVTAALLTACGGGRDGETAHRSGTAGVEIRVLSNRADLISGGTALVEVIMPAETRSENFAAKVAVDGRDVSAKFARRANGRVMGVVDDLSLGENVVTVRDPNLGAARITITNHPTGGPIFSGETLEPWLCTTANNGLGQPDDEACNAETVFEFFYQPSGGAGFSPYDPANPPSDVGSTTTDEGHTVPYIIRQETGTHNRGIYRVAVLYDPDEEWQPWAPQQGWNGKLHYPFGASCGTNHSQGDAQSVQLDRQLSRGYMVATSSLNVLGNTCNTVISAESVMMLKEHIVENYGEIRFTTAEGCSGGSIGQHMIANNYPGLLQGIQPNCSYMDNWSTGMEVVDCHILLNYYTTTSPHLWANAVQQTAVNGHIGPSSCLAWEALFAPVVNPTGGCGLSADQEYNAETNPTGCRGSVMDYNVAVVGRRPEALWDLSAEPTRSAERAAGGFARFPYDNVGVQYGLEALLSNEITTEQFVDLNEKIGAVDIDFNYTAERRVADTGSEVFYRTGGVTDGAELEKVAIIDLRGSSNHEIHTDYHSWGMRQRLINANGHADNHVIWSSPVPLIPTPAMADQSFDLLDAWLTAVEADSRDLPLEQKIAEHRPAEAVDACFLAEQKITDAAVCENAVPYFASPRLVAGMPISHDIAQCQLKPLDAADYAGALPPVTDADLERLRAVFPDGVCDYSKPGIGQQANVPWLSFATGPGGQELGPAPRSTPIE